MQSVQLAHTVHVNQGKAVNSRMQVGAAGERRLRGGAFGPHQFRHGSGRLILRHVVGPELRGENAPHSGATEQCDIIRRQRPALLEHAAVMLHRVREDRALSIAKRQLSEDHLKRPASGSASPRP